uniref:Uncharacterized protein n=1 Tax=viral metagenome TaxID=1070528 RepID=A0A6C0ENJ1_9ZZZZ
MATFVERPAVRVDAFQVHKASENINYKKLLSAYTNSMGGREALLARADFSITMDIHINRYMTSLVNTDDGIDQETLEQQRKLLDKILKNRLSSQIYTIKDTSLDFKAGIFYTLIYVKEQSPAFQRAYIEAFIQDCTTAYEGTDGMTCVIGALERIMLSLVSAIQAMRSLGEEKPEWDDLVDAITSTPQKKILELIQAWYKEHKVGDDGKATGFAEDEAKIRATARQANLKSYLLRSYPEHEALIEEKMQGLEYDDDDFKVLYGGRRRRRVKRQTRVRDTNHSVSKPHPKGKRYRKNKTRKLKRRS